MLLYPYHSPVREAKAELRSERNPKVGTDALTMKGVWLPDLILIGCSAFYRTQDHMPRDGTDHNGLGPSTLTTNLE